MTLLVISALLLVGWAVLLEFRRRSRARFSGPITPPPPPRAVRVLLAVAVVLLPVGAVAVAAPKVLCFGGGVDTGITLRGLFSAAELECVGVSDGGYDFSGGFADGEVGESTRARYEEVLDRIGAQNDALSGDHVKVALLAPLTSPLSGPRVVHEVAGLAAAQERLNAESGSPKVEVLLAHMGTTSAHWEPVVDELIAMKDDPAPLLAVVGLGLSQDESKFAARKLAGAGVLMVAGHLTATRLDPDGPIEHFHRTAFANARQFDATTKALAAAGVDGTRAIVVKSNDAGDAYASTSAEAIADQLGGQETPYRFGSDDEGVLGNQFRIISDKMCGKVDPTRPDAPVAVYYAGRARYLSDLMGKLDAESCLRKVIVVSASDAAVLRMGGQDAEAAKAWKVPEALEVVGRGKVELYYTPLADPVVIGDRPRFAPLREAFAGHEHELDTGWAVMSWDALHVAVGWIRHAQAGDPDVVIPQPETVELATQATFSDAESAYEGASGTFYFDAAGDRVDVAGDQPAVVRLLPDGSARRIG
ncbi:ABC-type branched-subunit amino acid transport system substrate-binding protein [Saccharothrix saharensis]|uniref:ABC-type branched-subunit amino acid transport system substrate-binding protein n=1 Tax=Saccharothrix saharensis TaxID=571190 RepID=A0A543JB47_9PSEU|nr:ABC transporter substrate-binding protein [Saccharothrix saharensis]TQM80053.1 ABC-type branched-subunit amino acid transport system substrate-binding protein [Saccharothrix saharensis]